MSSGPPRGLDPSSAAAFEEELASRNAKIAALEKELADRSGKVAAFLKELAGGSAKIAAFERELAERSSKIVAFEKEVADRTEEARAEGSKRRRLETDLATKTAEVEALSRDKSGLCAELAAKSSELEVAKDKIVELEANVAELEANEDYWRDRSAFHECGSSAGGPWRHCSVEYQRGCGGWAHIFREKALAALRSQSLDGPDVGGAADIIQDEINRCVPGSWSVVVSKHFPYGYGHHQMQIEMTVREEKKMPTRCRSPDVDRDGHNRIDEVFAVPQISEVWVIAWRHASEPDSVEEVC